MSGNAKAIRTRIRSVENTMHITRAMKLVASSKMKRATERMQKSRAFFDAVREAFSDLAAGGADSRYFRARETGEGRVLYLVFAGDRGLAGGYNANIFRLVRDETAGRESLFVAVGKRACDRFGRLGDACVARYPSLEKLSGAACGEIAGLVKRLFDEGRADTVKLIYTDYVSVLSQVARCETLLPIPPMGEVRRGGPEIEFEPDAGTVIDAIIPQYLTGILFGAAARSFASEIAARRNAMDSATDNAEEMIDKLSLSYNRARQAAITQEISEIVGGAANDTKGATFS